ncbi:hypothetical protein SISSUDRAFT_1042880 [Sistotremastrum suecicum HHB10207 ss-3]|uniref:Uncharacterized protein n=1 Tax=Sistotremastrum suecicum HHB10207 ss-3 TaxID=1314776 RepID=A0A166GBL6_9AGAM|nr:hypothetical protein SISSUDRAFT_1042880 [Sistotremastrum suecicum HHB10207 ss-3]
MASVNVTVEDFSPLISFSAGGWIDSSNDPDISLYSAKSFRAAKSSGAEASFEFTGSAVFVYGGFRSDYGPYTLTLNNQTVNGNAHSVTPRVGLLASFTGLSETTHHLHLANAGSAMDVDQIVYQTNSAAAPGKVALFTQRDESQATTKPGMDIGLFIGIVLILASVFIGVLATVIFLRRRKSRLIPRVSAVASKLSIGNVEKGKAEPPTPPLPLQKPPSSPEPKAQTPSWQKSEPRLFRSPSTASRSSMRTSMPTDRVLNRPTRPPQLHLARKESTNRVSRD